MWLLRGMSQYVGKPQERGGTIVKRKKVMNLLKEVDPEGVEGRRKKEVTSTCLLHKKWPRYCL